MTVANLTKQILSEHGVPEIVRSDNGPHFQGHYHNLSEEFGLQHMSSPHYPRSNGFIESQVKTVKKTLKKSKEVKHRSKYDSNRPPSYSDRWSTSITSRTVTWSTSTGQLTQENKMQLHQ